MATFKIGRPSSSSVGFDKATHLGHLLAFIEPTSEETTTKFGPADAARVPYVLCCTCKSVDTDVLLFGRALVPAVVGTDEDVVVGVLAQGEAKTGQSAPWILEDPTDEELEEAGRLLGECAVKMPSGRIVVEVPTL